MDQVDHRLGVRYPAGLLNKKLLNINLLNTKAPPVPPGGLFRKDTPSVKNQRFLPPPSVREARVQCKHDGVTDCHDQSADWSRNDMGVTMVFCKNEAERKIATGRGAQRLFVA